MKKFIEEFKEFALRGNMMDMAVGVIIGGAFSGIVTSLTDNFINPILNLVTGGQVYSLQDWMGFASSFISALVNFLIMAFVLFSTSWWISARNHWQLQKKRLLLQKYVRSASLRFLWTLRDVRTVHLYWKR